MPTSPRRQHGERVVADIESRNPAVDPGTPRCRRPVSSALFPTIPVRGRAGTGQPQRRSGRSPTPRRRHRREAGRTSGPAVSGRAHRSGSGCSRCAVRPRSRPHQERGEPPPGTAAGVRVRPSRGAAHRGHRPVRDVQVRAGSDGLPRAVHHHPRPGPSQTATAPKGPPTRWRPCGGERSATPRDGSCARLDRELDPDHRGAPQQVTLGRAVEGRELEPVGGPHVPQVWVRRAAARGWPRARGRPRGAGPRRPPTCTAPRAPGRRRRAAPAAPRHRSRAVADRPARWRPRPG